jgi:diguanylate cyclase (GGDEF)-like protein
LSILDTLEKSSPPLKRFLGFAIIGVIGTLDILTGYEMAFSLFYVMPISLAGWLMGRKSGLLSSLLSTLVWLLTDLSGHIYEGPAVPIWNTLVRLSFFSLVGLLLSALRSSVEHEKVLARTDYLTGVVNLRFFLELLQKEIDRSLRYLHPFTVVYVDLDNFKTVNDQFGHVVGDEVLRSLVTYITTHVRKTDVVARLGGDEFALLLPETTQESARIALTKLRDSLLEEMQRNSWPITFSVGVLTCTAPPVKADELVRMADELMYSVKSGGKNAIVYSNTPLTHPLQDSSLSISIQ